MKVAAAVLMLGMVMQLRAAEPDGKTLLDTGWAIQSSVQVQEKGDFISTTRFTPQNWYAATIPSTVLAALVQNKVYPDPYFGMNLRAIPGTTYAIGANFANLPMPSDSPFRNPWWFRKQFPSSPRNGKQVWLHFDGINYRANLWLNGRLIADRSAIAGAYRTYRFNITSALAGSGDNVLALEVFAPEVNDLAIEWVDWNPAPPDKNLGIWRDVYLTTAGPVELRDPQVVSKLDLPSLAQARLTVSAEAHNASNRPQRAVVRGRIENARFSRRVDLLAGETKTVTFSPEEFPQLILNQPKLWWPVQTGPQNLYSLNLQVDADTGISDQEVVRFGIREITSELTDKNYRVFLVNGKRVLIRGGAWAPDMLLRGSPERERAEIRYVKDMNLNTIRFEGKTESERFLDLCDREGILVIAGWSCCSAWERWKDWPQENHQISADSLRDQVRRIRNHPSILTWWYGSDGPPPAAVEQRYLDVLKANGWPNPAQSSATARPTAVSGPAGLKMTGPYEWVPPNYWLEDTRYGGAYGFNTETSPGPAVPPIESLKRMIPAEHLWPIDEYWNYHSGGGRFKTIGVFTEAMNNRLGKAESAEDFARKSQLLTYESQRAMFEAYGRNKYTSTGVIQWMINNAWPSLIWHLYDYYLRPGGGYFGTKIACEPLHIQYSYDDRSVHVVNSTHAPAIKLTAKAAVYNLDLAEKFVRATGLDAAPDSSAHILDIPEIPGLSPTYFVKLILSDQTGKAISSNFYWLSTQPDVLDEGKTTGTVYTPVKAFADMTALASLPPAQVRARVVFAGTGNAGKARVSLINQGKSLAFFLRLQVLAGADGEEILPVLWQDNYLSLLPGERRELTAEFSSAGSPPVLRLSGYNLSPLIVSK
jgi:exo-1,4-beta-D-glucosaminidase